MLKKKFKSFYTLSLVYQLGISIIVPIILGILLGLFLDKKLGTKPIFILLGVFLGMIISAFGVYYDLKPILQSGKKNESNNSKDK